MRQLFLVLLLGVAFASPALSQNFTDVRGQIDTKSMKAKEVTLCKVLLGRTDTIATVRPAASGAFGFIFQQETEGFFILIAGGDTHRLYLKPGDKANLLFTYAAAELTGVNTKENLALYDWEKKVSALKTMTLYFYLGKYTYKDNFAELERLDPIAQSWVKTVNTGNKTFDQLFKQAVGFDLEYYALITLLKPRKAQPTLDELPNFYKRMVEPNKYSNDMILKMQYGSRCVSNYTLLVNKIKGIKEPSLDSNLSIVGGTLCKGELALNSIAKAKSYEEIKIFESQFGRYLTVPDQKQRFDQKRYSLMEYKEGTPAYSFTYPDSAGTQHSLSDFKGKVVLVDVWATWCGPCKREIPSMQALEHEYAGKDVVFISVSLDEKKDYEKWKAFVHEKQMGGYQLFATGWSDIARDYRITGIPRFMVFDKKGNIVTVNAPRPSTPELKVLLDEQLGK